MDDRVSGQLGKIRDKFDHLGKSKGFQSLLMGVGLGAGQAAFGLIGNAASAAADFIGESVNAARDMNETVNKSRTVFGDASKGIEDFGSTTAQGLGISKQAAIDAAASFGFFFTGLGESQEVAAKMSEKLVTLAGDMASFNNMDPTETLDKLRAGLAGEAEPLRRLGVFLTEAKVKAKAMELGLAGANGEISEGAKVTARYNIILEESGVQAGDAARTIGELAGQQRVATASLKDAQAELGDAFQPIALEVTKLQIAAVNMLNGITGATRDTIQSLEAETAALQTQGGTLDGTVAILDRVMAAKKKLLENPFATQSEMDSLNRSITALETFRDKLTGADTSRWRGKARDDLIGSMGVAPALDKVGDTATDMGDKIVGAALKSRVSMDKMADGIRKVRDAFVSAAGDIIDDYYDPIIARAELTATKKEIADLRELTSGKKKTAEQKQQMAELEQKQAHLLLELASTNNASLKEINKAIDQWEAKSKGATAREQERIRATIRQWVLLKLGILAAKRAYNNSGLVKPGDSNRATGGPVWPGSTYTVGEEGPETLVMGSSGGFVIPNGGGGSHDGSIVMHGVASSGDREQRTYVTHVHHIYLNGAAIASAAEDATYYQSSVLETATTLS